METFKPHLDVLFKELREQIDSEESDKWISQEYRNLIKDNETLTREAEYELFLEELLKNGEKLFNPGAVITANLMLTLYGKRDVKDSFNVICKLWHDLQKIE